MDTHTKLIEKEQELHIIEVQECVLFFVLLPKRRDKRTGFKDGEKKLLM